MLKVHRRIEKLERAVGVSDRTQHFVNHFEFIDGDGTLAGTMVISDVPELRVPYQELIDGNRKEAE